MYRPTNMKVGDVFEDRGSYFIVEKINQESESVFLFFARRLVDKRGNITKKGSSLGFYYDGIKLNEQHIFNKIEREKTINQVILDAIRSGSSSPKISVFPPKQPIEKSESIDAELVSDLRSLFE